MNSLETLDKRTLVDSKEYKLSQISLMQKLFEREEGKKIDNLDSGDNVKLINLWIDGGYSKAFQKFVESDLFAGEWDSISLSDIEKFLETES